MKEQQQIKISGWREWLALPDIGIPSIEAKVDTGTKTSTLHTSFIESFRRGNGLWVRFGINPLPNGSNIRITCLAPVKTTRDIYVSDRHEETLFVIESLVQIGELQTTLELVLKSQGEQKFRMHLGRAALQDLKLQVDPLSSCLFGEGLKSHYEKD